MSNRKCPLIKSTCSMKECEWWDKKRNVCSVKTIANALYDISKVADNNLNMHELNNIRELNNDLYIKGR